MKLRDLGAVAGIVAVALFFTVGRAAYDALYDVSPVLVAFLKFALLATFGEMCVSRVTRGSYLPEGFGLVPKMVVWGVLGIAVYAAFRLFEGGVTAVFFAGGGSDGGTVPRALLRALLISVFMNTFFAPILMVTHHVSDLHIEKNGGRFPIRTLDIGALLESVNWRRFFGFVIARTIPLFWLPAHTVTFLLPDRFRLIYATGLSVVLGLFLALARRDTESSRTPIPAEATAQAATRAQAACGARAPAAAERADAEGVTRSPAEPAPVVAERTA